MRTRRPGGGRRPRRSRSPIASSWSAISSPRPTGCVSGRRPPSATRWPRWPPPLPVAESGRHRYSGLPANRPGPTRVEPQRPTCAHNRVRCRTVDNEGLQLFCREAGVEGHQQPIDATDNRCRVEFPRVNSRQLRVWIVLRLDRYRCLNGPHRLRIRLGFGIHHGSRPGQHRNANDRVLTGRSEAIAPPIS